MTITKHGNGLLDWIGLCSVLRPHQHSIGYMGDGFYRSKRPNQQYHSTQTNQTYNKQTWTQNTAARKAQLIKLAANMTIL